MARPHIEIILPVYNEVNNIQPLLTALDRVVSSLRDRSRITYLFVNDGSDDGSRQLLHRIFKDREDVRVVDLVHNFGHSAALACGIDHFSGDAALVMDADLQDSPAVLIEMFQAWEKGAKTIVARRKGRSERFRIFFRLFYFVLHKLSPTLPPIDFGTHCLLDRTVVERMRQLKERTRYFPGLVSYSSSKIYAVSADRSKRLHGQSRVGMFGLLQLAITAFVGFSNTPVRLVSLLGILCSAAALTGGSGIILIKLLTTRAIPGWASMMTAMFFGSGIQLLCLGIIGEYVARIHEEVKNRPLYLTDRIQDKAVSKSSKKVA